MQTDQTADVQQPSDEVTLASMSFYDAFSSRDSEKMARVWAKDEYVSAIHPSDPVPFLGPTDVTESWSQAFSEIEGIDIRPQSSIRHVSGSIAWVVDMSAFHVLFSANPDAMAHLHNVLSTQIFERREGQWLLAHYHGQLGFSFDHSD
jgi:ketosteroid isomerase-like protein